MRTVIRNEEGKISHVVYSGRNFVSVEDGLILDSTEVTPKMIYDVFNAKDSEYELISLLNGNTDVKQVKLHIFVKLGLIGKIVRL